MPLVEAYVCMRDEPAPVGSHPAGAGPYGAHDMAGNVWEWVADWYDSAYYASGPTTDPTGPTTGTGRICRGGYFGNSPLNIRAARRGNYPPDETYEFLGFRCAR